MILLAKLGIGVLGTAVVAGAALSSEGFIHVRVHEKHQGGDNVFVIVPAAVMPIAAHFMPQENLSEASQNIRPYLPVIDAAIPALEDCPDGVLVEVTDSDEHVLVSKSGGSLVVDVNDHDETVHVSLPLRAAQSTIHQIAEAEPPNLSH